MTGTSLIATMASRYSMDPVQFARTVRATAMPSGKTTDEQFAAFMMVAHEYNLNPITREIFAFPGRNGGITPVVSIDGWIHLVNAHPQTDGFEISYGPPGKDGKPVSATCMMWRKDRSHPVVVTEWLDEVYRNTDAWNGMTRRMLRHKAFKECARLAFGFAGITDEDEARDMRVVEPVNNQRITIDTDAKNTLDAFASGALDPDTTAAPSAGSVETSAPDIAAHTPSEAEVDFDTYQAADQRPAIIEHLFTIATDKRTVQDRLEGLDIIHTDLIDLHPALEPFIKDVTTTAVKVAKGELSPIAGRKYVEAML
jgi:phage recombination protein Bet